MRAIPFRPDGSSIRYVEIPGDDAPAPRLYLHGLGSSSPYYYAAAVAHPLLAGHRSLLLDLPGHGASDAPGDFGYTPEDHADAVAAALPEGAYDVIGHSMGGSVAIMFAARYPERVRRLVAVDANLDPAQVPPPPGALRIYGFTEEEFLNGGREVVLGRAGAHWASTMRMADPVGLYRSACGLALRTGLPSMRQTLQDLDCPRAFVYPAADGELRGEDALRASGVDVVAVPDCDHNIMLDNVDGFAEALAKALG
ncbi:alpha/beta hydrolase [Actinorhabdospora filicis]|uniref:Alpha/beta hydrolase n=1 Tax=Actinorhabdospora filicis TaxID=1785913 RepID=A0A9W6WCJ3_9ACTN|nr:alpha/beta hydrolase [Actinorhabdospora filicis]GLZ81143.1 alpha/beta hydrolase [Actinorhabdospora filicis]